MNKGDRAPWPQPPTTALVVSRKDVIIVGLGFVLSMAWARQMSSLCVA